MKVAWFVRSVWGKLDLEGKAQGASISTYKKKQQQATRQILILWVMATLGVVAVWFFQ